MFARNSASHVRASGESSGSNPANTFSRVSSVRREFRSEPYSPRQKNVSPPRTRTRSPRSVPRVASTASSSGPKSPPTGPTTTTRSNCDAASAKCVAAPPSIRSRAPAGVRTASNAIEPTTVIIVR